MRIKIFGFIAFVAIAVAAGFNYQQNKQEAELPKGDSLFNSIINRMESILVIIVLAQMSIIFPHVV